MKPRPNVVVKKGFTRNKPIRMKPGGLERLTGHSSFQIQKIHGGVIEKTVSVPRRCSEIPEVRDYKKQDPKHKERCFWLDYRFEIGPELTFPRQECEEQKDHAEQPANKLPRISPSPFQIVSCCAQGAKQQTNN